VQSVLSDHNLEFSRHCRLRVYHWATIYSHSYIPLLPVLTPTLAPLLTLLLTPTFSLALTSAFPFAFPPALTLLVQALHLAWANLEFTQNEAT
jgi:hypothetical protein